MAEKKRRLLRPYEWVLLAFVFLIMVHFGLQALGVNMHGRSSEMTWLDKPNNRQTPFSPSADRSREKGVDEVLNQIANQFAEGESLKSKPQDLQKKGLNKDESEFYRDLQQRKTDSGLSVRDWTNIVKTSYSTYQTVRSIFDMADGSKDDDVSENRIGQILEDVELTNRTFSRMEQDFGVPRAQLEAFAMRGGRALNDWATFIDQNKQD